MLVYHCAATLLVDLLDVVGEAGAEGGVGGADADGAGRVWVLLMAMRSRVVSPVVALLGWRLDGLWMGRRLDGLCRDFYGLGWSSPGWGSRRARGLLRSSPWHGRRGDGVSVARTLSALVGWLRRQRDGVTMVAWMAPAVRRVRPSLAVMLEKVAPSAKMRAERRARARQDASRRRCQPRWSSCGVRDGLSLSGRSYGRRSPSVLDWTRDDADVGDACAFDGVHDRGEGAEGDLFVGADDR